VQVIIVCMQLTFSNRYWCQTEALNAFFLNFTLIICLQCFDTVGLAVGREFSVQQSLRFL